MLAVFRAAALLALLLGAGAACAATLEVRTTDRDGVPLEHAVVWLVVPRHGASPPAEPVVVEQRRLRFSPLVQPVMAGTAVSFPNLDRVGHHLRVTGPTQQIEFPVYDPGARPAPVVLQEPGAHTLSCLFHGSMEGYVYVVDSPHFATTDLAGRATLQGLPRGEYELRAWHPDWGLAPLSARVKLGETPAQQVLQFRLKPRVRAAPRVG